MIVPVFLPHLGCRQKCIYCNQHHITGKTTPEGIEETIRKALDPLRTPAEVAIYGGNPLGLRTNLLSRLFALFVNYKEKIESMRISTQPIIPDARTIELLREYKVSTVELGMPVFSDEKLGALGRHHTIKDLYATHQALTRSGFTVGLQVMVGLPEETSEDLRLTVQHLARLKPAFVRIYPLVVLRHTQLYKAFQENRFNPLSLEQAVLRALFLYLHAESHGIKVIKTGLTTNEFLKSEIVAGPYHPSFGYLVRSEAFYRAMFKICEEQGLSGRIIILLNRKDVPHLTGHRRSNIRRLEAQGLDVTWAEVDVPVGRFIIEAENAVFQGTISDAVSTLPF